MTDYNALRREVLTAAREGRATYLPAGARANATALVLIDGEVIGQASVVGQFVDPEPGASRFGVSRLVPWPDWRLPAHLRTS